LLTKGPSSSTAAQYGPDASSFSSQAHPLIYY
jgi:hypothetical protein